MYPTVPGASVGGTVAVRLGFRCFLSEICIQNPHLMMGNVGNTEYFVLGLPACCHGCIKNQFS